MRGLSTPPWMTFMSQSVSKCLHYVEGEIEIHMCNSWEAPQLFGLILDNVSSLLFVRLLSFSVRFHMKGGVMHRLLLGF